MRILVSTPTFLPTVGGAELGIHEIYRRLAERHDVLVATPETVVPPDPSATAGDFAEDDYGQAGYEVSYLAPYLRRVRPTSFARGLGRTSVPYSLGLDKTIKAFKPDVLNFHFIRKHVLSSFRTRNRIPVLLSLVGRSDVTSNLNGLQRLVARRVLKNADLIVAISPYLLRSDPFSDSAEIVPYGVSTDTFTPEATLPAPFFDSRPESRPFAMISVQRLASVKRVDQQVLALAELRRRGRNAKLIVVGSGSEEQPLRTLTADLGLQDYVEFTGYVADRDLPAYLASSDVFVFHSLSETFGIVFAQAMAAGLPIVAARTSCVPDVVLEDNGLLFDPFDVNEFADSIEVFMDSEAKTQLVSGRNRIRAQNEFDWDQIAERYEQLLFSIRRI